MIKKIAISLIFLLLLISCKYKEKPEFIRAEKIVVENYKKGNVTVSADVFFKNHNDFGGKLITENIDVLLGDILIGKVNTKEFNVPARDTFSIPITATFDILKQIKTHKEAFGGNLISILLKNEFTLTFKGPIKFTKGPLFYTYDLNQTNTITLKR